ncbi:hypothetical protein LAV_00066 [Sphingobium phage Lacusarx]|uniref:Phosphohydrolase n=1 Tax=Sphingobium phage Lacusarx TaxID=1980139 RepID=A0A1W6DX80_9CAUD|nr:deoxyribonucleoside 5' monophosphate phosphatase [Sphingobium phage Lacusarx]ARK07466.1 hypothetical protein LAV_00066 [Sphingobium phage Lacusarx]
MSQFPPLPGTPDRYDPALPPIDCGFPTSDWIQLPHGRVFAPLEPKHPINKLDIEYIAHSLSLQCRWMGGTSDLATGDPIHYSVAQHCVIVADLVNLGRQKLVPDAEWERVKSPALYGLMHDASEAYLCDVPRPLKPYLGGYYDYERELMSAIIDEFSVPVCGAIVEATKKVDNMMIFLERDKLIGKPPIPYGNEADHPGVTIDEVVPEFYCWSPKEAKRMFLEKFEEINRWQGNYVPLGYANRGYGI